MPGKEHNIEMFVKLNKPNKLDGCVTLKHINYGTPQGIFSRLPAQAKFKNNSQPMNGMSKFSKSPKSFKNSPKNVKNNQKVSEAYRLNRILSIL